MIEFFLAMDPPTVTAQQHQVIVRNGKPAFYDPDRLKDARRKLTNALHPRRPKTPFRGPLRLIVKWCFRANAQHPADTWRVERPDTDNLNKLLKDVMTDCGYWADDAQVCSEIIEKFWAATPGIWIHIEALL